MKKFFLFLVVNLLVGNAIAQTDPAQLKKEGDEALTAKNYAVAYEKYNEYLKQTEYKDSVTVFNCAVCADQVDKFADAAKYFEMSVKEGYKPEQSYTGLAKAYRDLKKDKEFVATIKEGLEKFPGSVNMEKMLYVQCMKQGQAFQKANEIKKAEDSFEQALIISDKKMKANVLYTLGALYFNGAATDMAKAAPLATSDPDKYKAAKAGFEASFTKSEKYLKELLEVSPDHANAKKLLTQVVDIKKQLN